MTSSATMSSVPRPRHFITRPDGTMTPLIALDEMPDDVRIINVPTTLTPEQTVGMMSMGLEPKGTGKYSVEVTDDESVAGESVAVDESMVAPPVPTATKPGSVEPGTKSSPASTFKDLKHSQHAVQEEPSASNTQHELQQVQHGDSNTFNQLINAQVDNQAASTGNAADSSDVNIIERSIEGWRRTVGTGNPPDNTDTSPPRDTPPMTMAQVQQNRQPYAPTVSPSQPSAHTVATGSQPYAPTVPGVFNRKIYCSHWVRTGECDFMQQGCIFQHIMPDLKTLASLGFRSYPRWYRENCLMEAGPTAPIGSNVFHPPPQQASFRPPPAAIAPSQFPRPSLAPRLSNIDQTPMYSRPGPASTYTGSVAHARGQTGHWNRWPQREERPGRDNRGPRDSRNPGDIRLPRNRVYQPVDPWRNGQQPRVQAPAPQRRGSPSIASEWNPNLPPQPFDRVIRNAAPPSYRPRDLITATPSITESVISTMPPSPTLTATPQREVNVPSHEPVRIDEAAPSSSAPTPAVNLPTSARPMVILARPRPSTSSTSAPPQTTCVASPNSAPSQMMAAPTSNTVAATPTSAPPQVTAAPTHTSAAADQTSVPPQMMAASGTSTPNLTTNTPQTSSTQATGTPQTAHPPATAPHLASAPTHSSVRPHRREKTRIYGPQPLPQYPSLRPAPPIAFGSAPPAPPTPPNMPTHRPLYDLLPPAPETLPKRRFVAPDVVVLDTADEKTAATEGDDKGKKVEVVRDVKDPAIAAQGNVAGAPDMGDMGSPKMRRDRRRRPSDDESNLMDLSAA